MAVPLARAELPGAHSLQAALLLLPGRALAFPGEQPRQEELLECPRSGLYLPAAHGVNASASDAAEASGQKPPDGQLSQAVLPGSEEKLPGWHALQSAWPSSSWYCPGLHEVHELRSLAPKLLK